MATAAKLVHVEPSPADQLAREGYAVVRNAVGEDTAAALCRLVSQQTDSLRAAKNSARFGRIQTPLGRHDLLLDLDAPVAAALNELLSGVAGRVMETVVGSTARVMELAAISSDPGARAQRVHADTMHGVISFLQADRGGAPDAGDAGNDAGEDDEGDLLLRSMALDTAPLFTCLVALQQVEPTMGPTLIWPGTNTVDCHTALWATRGPSTEALSPEEADVLFGQPHEAMTLAAGDAVVYDSRTIHCGGANVSSTRRSVLCVSLLGDGLPPHGSTFSILPALKGRFRLADFPSADLAAAAAAGSPVSVASTDGSVPLDAPAPATAPPAQVPPLCSWRAAVVCVACGKWRPCDSAVAADWTVDELTDCVRCGFSCDTPQGYTVEEIDAWLQAAE